ncbi:MAG: tyrosine-type recombinase/integrase [Microbacterium sp.]
MGSVYAYTTAAGEKRYRIVYRRPDHSQTSERGFTRKRDAEQRLAEVEVSKGRGEYVNPADAAVTIGTLGAAWLKAKEQALKPSTYRTLDAAWRVHVRPRWGTVAVGQVRHSDVRDWVASLSADRSATVVLRAYGILAGILDVAVRDRRIATNRARDLDNLPRKKGKDRVYLTHEQVAALAGASGKHSTLILTAAYTGLRWGELAGLRVQDVDADRRRLQVAQNAVRVGSIVHVGTPKTHEQRSVPVPRFLVPLIVAECEGKTPSQLVFGDGTTHLLRPQAGSTSRSWFKNATEAAGVAKMSPHDLRHTAASLAISAGANVKAVQRMLGHASAAMTLDTYADLFDDDLDAVAEALDQARSR